MIWVLAVGCLALGAFAGLGYGYYLRGRRRRGFDVWRADLQHRLERHAEASLYMAQCESEVAELLADIPPDYVHPVFVSMRLAWRAQRAAIQKARELGLAGVDLDQHSGEPEPPRASQQNVVPMRREGFEMRGGRLVPRGGE